MSNRHNPEHHYHWEWTLQSSPEALWPLLADTDRFNRDTGFAPIVRIDSDEDIINARKRARQIIFHGLLTQEWQEEPFEWVRPYRYSTLRKYTRGIFQYIRQQLVLKPLPDGGTFATYDLYIQPKNAFWAYFINGSFSNNTIYDRVFRHYDAIATAEVMPVNTLPDDNTTPTPTPEAEKRLSIAAESLINQDVDDELVARLMDFLRHADDLTAMKIRPYALADSWNAKRRHVLEMCLYATRLGILDLSWDALCPLCRGTKGQAGTMSGLSHSVTCDVCHINFEIDFERSVELSFHPNPQIRPPGETQFCVGGPEITPHVVLQRLMPPSSSERFAVNFKTGRYRARTLSLEGGQFIAVENEGLPELKLTAGRWRVEEPTLAQDGEVVFINDTNTEQLFLLEQTSWSNQAVTAAEVTTLQTFRDLFASEALRPGEQIAINSLTVVFTDLRGSTAMYQEIGDAPAFGLVMEHFDILRAAIREEDGALIKTIGDAVMAIFRQPANAVRAMLKAQMRLSLPHTAQRPLKLRVGIHTGACIAVTLNDHLDYFGTVVNVAARLEGLSNGEDLIISNAVHADPQVSALLDTLRTQVVADSFSTSLKGFGEQQFELWRLVSLNRAVDVLRRQNETVNT